MTRDAFKGVRDPYLKTLGYWISEWTEGRLPLSYFFIVAYVSAYRNLRLAPVLTYAS